MEGDKTSDNLHGGWYFNGNTSAPFEQKSPNLPLPSSLD